jgi:hypothetical protein
MGVGKVVGVRLASKTGLGGDVEQVCIGQGVEVVQGVKVGQGVGLVDGRSTVVEIWLIFCSGWVLSRVVLTGVAGVASMLVGVAEGAT